MTFGIQVHSRTFRRHSGHGSRVDFVAVPLERADGIVSCYVSSVDLLSGDFDHAPVAVNLSLSVRPASSLARPHRAIYGREEAFGHPGTLAAIVDSIPTCDVHIDVDKHWHVIERHCRKQLQRRFPKGKRVRRQQYFSLSTWQLLEDRKDLDISIRALGREVDLCTLRSFFNAWRTPDSL